MTNFILIAFCISVGFLFKKKKLVSQDAHKTINTWIIYVALPAVSFKYLPHLNWSYDLLIPALSPVLIFVTGIIFVHGFTTTLKLNKQEKGAMQLSAGLANTSFVGFPLILAYFSDKEIGIAVICDQMTFILFSVFGIIIAIRSSDGANTDAKQVLRKLFTFPPLLGCVTALLIPKETDLSAITPFFHTLAGTVAPLALFSIGLQLECKGRIEDIKKMIIVLSYKLFIAPALVLAILLTFGIKGTVAKIAVFEAAMAVLLSLSILTDTYNLNPKGTNLLIGTSILFSFFTTWIWYQLITIFL